MSAILPDQNPRSPSGYEVPKILPSTNNAPDLNSVYNENQQNGGLRDLVTTAAGIPFLDKVVSAASSIAGSISNLGNDIKAMMSDPRYLVYSALLQTYKASKIAGFGTASFLGKVTQGISDVVSIANQASSVQGLIDLLQPSRDESGVERDPRMQPRSIGDALVDKFYSEFQKLNYGNNYSTKPQQKGWSDKVVTYWSDDPKIGTVNAPMQGYKNIYGFSLDSTHLWDIGIKPYTGGDNNNITYLDNPPGSPVNDGEYWIPALDYNLSDATLSSENLSMSAGTSGLTIPMFYMRNNSLSITITDNQLGEWYEYFRSQMDKIASKVSMAVAPYKHVTYQVNIYVLDVGAHIRYLRKLLCVLDGHRLELVGTRDPSVVNYQLPFQVVGELES